MNIQELLQEKNKAFTYKNFAPIKQKLDEFLAQDIAPSQTSFNKIVQIGQEGDLNEAQKKLLNELLLSLKPWRKGPFDFFGKLVDAEWQSHIKYSIIEPYLQIENKTVLDVGCNNGYYLFRMLEKNPRKLIGLDPSALFKMQFLLANHWAKSNIEFELLGVENIEDFVSHRKLTVDMVVFLGVLYHRIDPIGCLKQINRSLKKGGEVLLDCFMIDGEEEVSLTPKSTYSQINNIYFIPTVNALKNWLGRANFDDIRVIGTHTTGKDEQRKTKWIDTYSLEDFIDEDTGLTVEGYPRPKRCYIIAKK